MRAAAIAFGVLAGCGPHRGAAERPAVAAIDGGVGAGGVAVASDGGAGAQVASAARDAGGAAVTGGRAWVVPDGPPCERACSNLYWCRGAPADVEYSLCVAGCDRGRTDELTALAAMDCDELAATLGAARSPPIRARDCMAVIAGRAGAPARAGRRALLLLREWCVTGAGPLSAGSNRFGADGVLRSGAGAACWTLDGAALVWTRDGIDWRRVAVRWPARPGAPIVAGGQRLAPCPPPVLPPPPGDDHGDSSSNR